MPSATAPRLTRRNLLKNSGLFSAAAMAAPLAAVAGALPESASDTQLTTHQLVSKGTPTDNLFTQIGVRPVVNARGTFTIISGSQSLPEVKQAMFEASQYYVQMDEMMAAVGAEIAQHMGAPSAIVTCGCEAAIALATIACRVGMDPELSQSIPYKSVRDEVIIPKYSRNQYDFAVRMSGPKIIEVESEDELRGKLNERTAMIYIISGPRAFKDPLSIKTVCAIAKEKGVPVFVDAAAEEPLVPNIHLVAGATFVGYSGGKCMRGPQTAGVLLGPKDLCAAAFWNAAPHHNYGRALKVGKEEAMGMLAAVRMWYKRDHDGEQKQWLAWNQSIADALKGIPSLTVQMEMPSDDLSNRAPTLHVKWDAAAVGITGTELVAALDAGTPRIFVVGGAGTRPDMMASSFTIMPYMMQPGDAKIVADGLSMHLRHPGAHANPPAPAPGPTAQIAGTWNVAIQYRRGVGHQKLVLQQSGGAISGDQNGEMFNAKIAGKVQSSEVTLKSSMRANGSTIPFTFTGAVNGGSMSGDVKMGEYGAGTFIATKA
jgi:uncharacterized pyridoxal phosphate-dependent enzyme